MVVRVETREAEVVVAEQLLGIRGPPWFGDLPPHAEDFVEVQHGVCQHRLTVRLHHPHGLKRRERRFPERRFLTLKRRERRFPDGRRLGEATLLSLPSQRGAHRRLLLNERLDRGRVLRVVVLCVSLHVGEEAPRRRRVEHPHLLARGADVRARARLVHHPHRHHRDVVRGREPPKHLPLGSQLERRRARPVLRPVPIRADDEVAVWTILYAAEVAELEVGMVRARETPHHASRRRELGDGGEVRNDRVAVRLPVGVERELANLPLRDLPLFARVELAHETRAGAAHEPRAERRRAAHAVVVVDVLLRLAVQPRGVALESADNLALLRQLGEEVGRVLGDQEIAVLQQIEAVNSLARLGTLAVRARRGIVEKCRLPLARLVHAPEAAVGVEEASVREERPVDVAAAGLLPHDPPVGSQQVDAAARLADGRNEQRHLRRARQHARPLADRAEPGQRSRANQRGDHHAHFHYFVHALSCLRQASAGSSDSGRPSASTIHQLRPGSVCM